MFKKGYTVSEETRKKISIAQIGRKHSEETKRKMSMTRKGMKRPTFTKEWIEKIRKAAIGRKHTKETKRKIGVAFTQQKHPNWQGGISKSREHINRRTKKYRHRIGVSKKYISDCNISSTKEYKKLQRQKRKALMKNGGPLTIKTIQLVYEDNIKQYGTLTCIYCLKPIEFGKDTLEHKQPISKNGTNQYNNLAIACKSCNCKKHTKTYSEYIAIQNGDF